MQKNWKTLEDTVTRLTQEVMNLQETLCTGLRTPTSVVVPARYAPSPSDDYMNPYTQGHLSMSSMPGHDIVPFHRQNTLPLH